MCTVVDQNEFRNTQLESPPEPDWLRSELFFAQAEALFKPVGLYIRSKLKEKHGLDTTSTFSFGDGRYFADPLQCWTYGFLTVVAQNGRSWTLRCSVYAREHSQRCSFTGDVCTIQDVFLEESLEWVCATLFQDAEAKLLSLM